MSFGGLFFVVGGGLVDGCVVHFWLSNPSVWVDGVGGLGRPKLSSWASSHSRPSWSSCCSTLPWERHLIAHQTSSSSEVWHSYQSCQESPLWQRRTKKLLGRWAWLPRLLVLGILLPVALNELFDVTRLSTALNSASWGLLAHLHEEDLEAIRLEVQELRLLHLCPCAEETSIIIALQCLLDDKLVQNKRHLHELHEEALVSLEILLLLGRSHWELWLLTSS